MTYASCSTDSSTSCSPASRSVRSVWSTRWGHSLSRHLQPLVVVRVNCLMKCLCADPYLLLCFFTLAKQHTLCGDGLLLEEKRRGHWCHARAPSLIWLSMCSALVSSKKYMRCVLFNWLRQRNYRKTKISQKYYCTLLFGRCPLSRLNVSTCLQANWQTFSSSV